MDPQIGDPRLPPRFWSKVSVDERGCWRWIGAKQNSGYGTVKFCGKNWRAHRAFFTALVGPIKSETLDHLCRVRECVNPAHLEQVTHKENCHRGPGSKTHCYRGHQFSDGSFYVYGGRRHCKRCVYLRLEKSNSRQRARRKESENVVRV